MVKNFKNKLKFFNHPEGYVEPDGQGNFDYIYQYKDHLGNIRLSYRLDGMETEMDNFNDGTTGSWGAHSSTISNEDDQLKVVLTDAEVGVFKVISVTAGEALKINLDLEMDTTDKVSLYEYGTGKLSDLVEGDNEINYTPTVSGDFILLIVKDPTSDDVGVPTIFYLDNIEVNIGEDVVVIVEENNFYPFGMVQKGYNSNINGVENNHQTFQGQEEEKELGKNTYAYQWRDYDPAIGRFNKVDRFAEKYYSYSPYGFTKNNPILYVEIAGDSLTKSAKKWADKIVDHANKNISSNNKKLDNLNNNLKNGEISQEKYDRKSNRLKESNDKYQTVVSEIGKLEGSNQWYDVKEVSGGLTDKNGNKAGAIASFDFNSGMVVIQFDTSYGFGEIAHDFKHAYQFEVGEMDFNENGMQSSLTMDIYDERSANERSKLFYSKTFSTEAGTIYPKSLGNYNSNQINGAYKKLQATQKHAYRTHGQTYIYNPKAN